MTGPNGGGAAGQRSGSSRQSLEAWLRLCLSSPKVCIACTLQFVCVLLLMVDFGVAWALLPSPGHHNHAMPFFLLVTLAAGTAFSGWSLRKISRQQNRSHDVLFENSVSFVNLIGRHFTEWSLTPSERQVAVLAIKGLPIAEISRLRQTRPGTIKSQCNAIYRKAGVSGRPQLISLFIEELMDDGFSIQPISDGSST